MAYLTFYNPYHYANHDEASNAQIERMNRQFSNTCGCVPAANIHETDTEYRVELALPGVEKDTIRIKHENGLLMVSVDQKEDTESVYKLREFDYTGTGRVFKTGDKVNADNITAKYENGILLIILPKKEAYIRKPAQQIAIN